MNLKVGDADYPVSVFLKTMFRGYTRRLYSEVGAGMQVETNKRDGQTRPQQLLSSGSLIAAHDSPGTQWLPRLFD